MSENALVPGAHEGSPCGQMTRSALLKFSSSHPDTVPEDVLAPGSQLI
jgi:hypothetical protein